MTKAQCTESPSGAGKVIHRSQLQHSFLFVNVDRETIKPHVVPGKNVLDIR